MKKRKNSTKTKIAYYINKTKDVPVSEFFSVFTMALAWAASPLFKKKNASCWVISERKDEARDNGYALYKYLRANHPEVKCVYVIDKQSPDYKKVKDLGKIVQFGSFKHWSLYFSGKYLISPQSCKPSPYLCTAIERLGLFKPVFVFLQHGITKDRAEFLLPEQLKASLFIAGAEPEYEFMKKEFGYPNGTMQYTGFARFDALHDAAAEENKILIMPTWRKWLRFKSETHDDAQMDIDTSDYLICWRKLLQSRRLEELISRYKLNIVFYPHPNMKGILDPQSIVGSGIHVADIEHDDLQKLLMSSQMLITDYSSVFFDMAYMKRPIIFYQFDEDKYRKYHYQQGWFDYHNTEFGSSYSDPEDVINAMEEIINKKYKVSDQYMNEHKRTFTLYDNHNCERIYKLLSEPLF